MSRNPTPGARSRCRNANWCCWNACARASGSRIFPARPQWSRTSLQNSDEAGGISAQRITRGSRMMTGAKIAIGAVLASLLSQVAAAQQTVTLMAYSGLFQERYTKAVVEPFMKANPGIKVEYFPMPNSAQMLGNLRAQKAAPQADVVIMDVSVSKAATDEKLFTKIDEKTVPNVADLHPTARIADVDGVAVTFDNLVLIYNTDVVKEAP